MFIRSKERGDAKLRCSRGGAAQSFRPSKNANTECVKPEAHTIPKSYASNIVRQKNSSKFSKFNYMYEFVLRASIEIGLSSNYTD